MQHRRQQARAQALLRVPDKAPNAMRDIASAADLQIQESAADITESSTDRVYASESVLPLGYPVLHAPTADERTPLIVKEAAV
jgi:hypothetical protein